MGPILSVNGGLPPVHVRVVWTHSVMVVLSRVIVEALATGAKEALKSTSATVDARERSLVTSFLGPRATGDCTGWRTSMSLPIDVTECLNNWESEEVSQFLFIAEKQSQLPVQNAMETLCEGKLAVVRSRVDGARLTDTSKM